MLEKASKLQDSIIQALLEKASANWIEIVVNYELDDQSGNYLAFLVRKNISVHERLDFRLGFDLEDMFYDLRETYRQISDPWSTADVRISSNGEFTFDFSYEPPYRIIRSENGQLDDPRFDNYLEKF